MATKTLKKDLKRKDGFIFPEGTRVTIEFPSDYRGMVMLIRDDLNNILLTKSINFFRIFGVKEPSMKTLEKYVYDGISKSLLGKKVEPDGIDPDGSPSVLLLLGIL